MRYNFTITRKTNKKNKQKITNKHHQQRPPGPSLTAAENMRWCSHLKKYDSPSECFNNSHEPSCSPRCLRRELKTGPQEDTNTDRHSSIRHKNPNHKQPKYPSISTELEMVAHTGNSNTHEPRAGGLLEV